MKMNLLDQIGDWNPQLFRELKGRLKLRNVAIVVAVLIAAQILLLFYCQQVLLPSTEAVTRQIQKSLAYTNGTEAEKEIIQRRFGYTHSSEVDKAKLIKEIFGYTSRFCTGSIIDRYSDRYSKYSSSKLHSSSKPTCLLDPNTKQVLINWQVWWQEVFKTYTWMLPYILLLPGTYLLVTDFSQEEKRGTLNFIRLSPQSVQSILTGKLLGVPVLAYL